MEFESFASAQSFLLWAAFGIALVMGAVVNKTNFCTMGAVSDVVNMGDTGRMRAWIFAMAVAILGVTIIEAAGIMSVTGAFPPYRASELIWAENLLGGFLFGIGMTFASGCGNKCLIRIGGGNVKSIMVLIVIGVVAYFMVNPFPGTDKTLFSELFYPWIRPLAISLPGNQDLGAMVAGQDAGTARLVIGLIATVALLVYVFKSTDFRGSFDNILGGLVVGLAVLAGWYVSGTTLVNADGDVLSLGSYVQNWDLYAMSNEGKPAEIRPLSTQSYTFINPMGQATGYVAGGFNAAALTFGLMGLFGVILGSFAWSILSKGFRIEWFANFKDFVMHFIGAILMGLGGVLGLGCTIGQGVTGISTLALGSIITFVGIVFGSALTMKIQYYKMCYEDEATFMAALLSSLVDMKLLPKGLRKLEAM
jgi:uncharacterized membrane protein YedE/YeeE